MQARTLTVLAVLIGLASVRLIAQSQEPTLRELAMLGRGGATRMIQCCGPMPSLADVVKSADLIVEGIVKRRTVYLTADERDIFTDYDLAIVRVLFQREVLLSSRPGVAVPLIFKSHGGQVVVDGLRLGVDVRTNSVRVTLAEGDHTVLFGKRDPIDGKWRVNPFDVFAVGNDGVVPPTDFSDLPKSLPVDAFVQMIYRLQLATTIPR